MISFGKTDLAFVVVLSVFLVIFLCVSFLLSGGEEDV
jgi:hypothetical protein